MPYRHFHKCLLIVCLKRCQNRQLSSVSVIFIAEQPVGNFILLDLRKPSHRLIEAVVSIVVIAHGHLSYEAVALTLFHIELMIASRI